MKLNEKKIDLTVVVTTHHEGLVAHKTMQSIFAGLEKLTKDGYVYEVIVHIDDGDAETIKYFERYKKDEGVRIFGNKFGDTGPSRNYAVQKARGEFVAFMDGDDLISDNWFSEAVRMLKVAEGEIVVHPEAILTFGIEQPNILTLQRDSFDLEKDTMILLGENRWCSVLVARKTTLLKIPYRVMDAGYGHEDYVFNIEAMQRGVLHKIAKRTVLFYRRSQGSRLSSGNEQHLIIPYMEAFGFEKIAKFSGAIKQENKKKSLKTRGYKIYKKIRDNDFLNYFITPVAKMTLKALEYESGGKRRRRVPEFVEKEWIKINKIDSQLYPHKNTLKRVLFYRAEEQIAAGEVFRKIAQTIKWKPDYVFIVPWIVRGGADKVLFNYIKAIKKNYPDATFTVITTLAAKNIWASNLPNFVDFVDFGNLTAGLTPEAAETVFSRLITQLDCKNLHIINSEYGYNWVRKHKDLVRKHYNLNVSLFAWEYIPDSKMQAVYSYDNPCLFEIFDVVKKVFTDNKAIIKYAVEKNGFDAQKFKVHYQPVDNLKIRSAKGELADGSKMRILWAGRVTAIKLPKLVAEIGKHIDAGKIQIDVYGEQLDDVSSRIFDGIPAIKYHGAYDGFASLPVEKSDMLLYTSLTDGIPNVILEATAAGLPIIASNDGGVGEFIQDGKTGILIDNYLDYKEYLKAFQRVQEKPEEMTRYVQRAQELLLERHSFDEFAKVVKKDIAIR